jgi:hypothetical protein
MSVSDPWPKILDFFGTPLVIKPSPGQLSSDAGLLPIRQFDRASDSLRLAPAPSTSLRPPSDWGGFRDNFPSRPGPLPSPTPNNGPRKGGERTETSRTEGHS